MRSLFPAFLFALVLAQALPAQASWCRPDAAPKVSVKSDTDKITWNFTKSQAELNRLEIDTVNPYGQNVITDVGGLMQGGIQMSETMKFGSLTNPNTNEICMFYNAVEIKFHIQPTIFIASEHPPGSCMHNAIKQHEMKHINMDRKIVNKYARLVGTAAQNEVRRKYIYGPVPVEHAASLQSQMKQRLEQILIWSSQQMDTERRKLQQGIDSLAEYERVNAQCKGSRRR